LPPRPRSRVAATGRRGSSSAACFDEPRGAKLVPAIVVVEGYLALTSSRNDGTGFVVPLLPPAIALVVVAALKVPWRAARTALIAAFVLVAAFNVAS